MNVAELLDSAAIRFPNAPAIYSGCDVWMVYRDLADRVARLANWLADQGISPGDRVAIVLPNCLAYLEVLYAIFHSGAIAVPVNFKLHSKELAYILNDSRTRVCFGNDATIKTIKAAAAISSDTIQVQSIESSSYATSRFGEAAMCCPRINDDIAWLFYTSGTTGMPKGAALSHGNLLLMSMSYLCEIDNVESNDKVLHAAPLSHGSGMYNFAHIMRGAGQIIPESCGFNVTEIGYICGQLSGISMFVAPTMIHRILTELRTDDDLPGLKHFVYGGGPMLVEKIREAIARFGPRLIQIYGQGECPMTITRLTAQQHTTAMVGDFSKQLASVGKPFHMVDVRIGDPEKPMVPGEIGEVLVNSPIVMQGYWSKNTDIQVTQRPLWLETGDIGFFDEFGFLYLCDRAKDVIISGGSNIYSREIEDVLITHPNIAEVAVIGRESEEWGEEVVAVLSCLGRSTPSIDELDALCRENIASFKRPRAYIFLPELPKNAYGKIEKRKLKEMLVSVSNHNSIENYQ